MNRDEMLDHLGHYILDDAHNPVRCAGPGGFARWEAWTWGEGGKARRIVAQDKIGPARISTVFLGMDHGFTGGPPILFETMVFFDGDVDQYQERYCTWDEALEGHDAAVSLVRARLKGE